MVDSSLGWRLVNRRMPKEWTVSLVQATEQLREKHRITRDRQDEFAVNSHRLATMAWDQGHYDSLTVKLGGVKLNRDQTIRPDTTIETLAELRTALRKDGTTVTAGNASPLNDGASAAWIGSGRASEVLGTNPQARVAGWAAAANEPQYFGYAPVEAATRALSRAGINWHDVGAVELNEAFAAQALVCLDAWGFGTEHDPSIVNAWGGAIAIGHPLGATGTRVLATLARRMEVSGVQWGVAPSASE